MLANRVSKSLAISAYHPWSQDGQIWQMLVLALAYLIMKLVFATLKWRESTTRITEYDAIAREVTAGKARPSEQTRSF